MKNVCYLFLLFKMILAQGTVQGSQKQPVLDAHRMIAMTTWKFDDFAAHLHVIQANGTSFNLALGFPVTGGGSWHIGPLGGYVGKDLHGFRRWRLRTFWRSSFSKLVVCGSRACWCCPNGEMRGFLWFPKINRICKGSERGIGLKKIDLGSKNEINSGDQEKKHDKWKTAYNWYRE